MPSAHPLATVARPLLKAWLLAQLLSLLLKAAGRQWGSPPAVATPLVWLLAIAPPLLTLVWLWSHWQLQSRKPNS